MACMIMILEYLRNQKVLHRDIKPENIIFDENGYVYLTDFGIGKIYKSDNSGDFSGTPGYLSPEVLNGKHHSFQSDYFSLGIIAYELMFGKRPYRSTNKKQYKEEVLAYKIILTQDNNKYNWSIDGLDFINGLLTRNQDRRLGAHDIEELKTHKWFKNFDFASLFRKEIESPLLKYIDLKDNFNEKYCNQAEVIDNETKNRYSTYVNKESFISLFIGFTYMNSSPDENKQNYSTSMNNERNTTSTEKGINNIKDNRVRNTSSNNMKSLKHTNSIFVVEQEYKKILPLPQKHQCFLRSQSSANLLPKQNSMIHSSVSTSNINNSIEKETYKIGKTLLHNNTNNIQVQKKFSPLTIRKRLLSINDEKDKNNLRKLHTQNKNKKDFLYRNNLPIIIDNNNDYQKQFALNKCQSNSRLNSNDFHYKFNSKDGYVQKEKIKLPKIKKKIKH